MKILNAKDFREMKWKNGKGMTNELLRIPHPQHPDLFSLRISIASMKESGPFSHYPGIERTIVLLEGNGVVLDFVDEIKMNINQVLKPIQFPGEAEIEGTLINGPIRDFNVMAARDALEAYVEVHKNVPQIMLGGDSEHFCYIVEGNAESGADKFSTQDLILLEKGEKKLLKSKGSFTVIDIKTKRAH